MTTVDGGAILQVSELTKHFPLTLGVIFKKTVGQVRAVDGVSFTLKRGETLGPAAASPPWPSC
jgi:ABC-type oligopeptide transport system ATPase subunit